MSGERKGILRDVNIMIFAQSLKKKVIFIPKYLPLNSGELWWRTVDF